MESDYTVFISAKHLDDVGHPTRDWEIAQALWEFLTEYGFRVFFSNVSLERMGVSAYTRAIDDALDRVQVLVVVCASGARADSRWVRYEWDSFLNDIRSGIKPDGHVFVYLVDELIRNLPRGLRHTQCIEHESDGFARLARFIANAIGQHPSASEPTESSHARPALLESSLELAGEWEGEWKRDKGRIVHQGNLSISQTGRKLTALMTVTFEKRGQRSILKERLRGLVTSRGIVLQGESVEYEERGLSTSYLLDHFELELDSSERAMSGDFYSKRGRGRASFRRVPQRAAGTQTRW
ncbi:toll/interleukin-1 receptor domain-containing protein [bacterium]|nr:toll/interleukin-1 receptor domain-containing protein [bacterium]